MSNNTLNFNQSNVKKFSPKLDFLAKIVTAIVVVLCLSLITGFLINFKLIPLVLICASLLLALSYFPIYFTVTQDAIIIKTVFTKKTIPLIAVTNVYAVNNTIPYSFGSKGVFGYLGKTMDGSIAYSTSLNKNVLIKTNQSGNFIISPKNSEEFIKAVNSRKIES